MYGCDRDYAYDILCEASSRKIVDGSSDTLHNGTISFCLCETLNKLISDISCIQIREYKNVCLAGNR